MRPALLCSITVATVAFAAGAQQGPTSGTEAPGQSFSLTDDGAALLANPGGLGFASGLELDLLHSGSYLSSHARGNALLVTAGIGPLALGWGSDELRPAPCGEAGGSCAFTRRTSLGFALRIEGVGLGAVHRGFSGGAADGVSAWDFGAMARPARWLSLGAAALDANRPSALPRRWRLSLGLRPLGEVADAAFDLGWTECTNATGPCGLSNDDVAVTLRARVAPGVTLFAQGGRFLEQDRLVAGLQLDFSHLGITYAPRFAGAGAYEDEYRVRVSSDRWPGLRLPIRHAAEIDLDKALRRDLPGLPGLLLGYVDHDPLARTLAALRRLGDDPGLGAVVLRSGGLSLGLGKTEELRAAIERLQARGKKVVFYLESGGDLEYSLASAADRIYAAPQAVLLVNGLSATALFAAAGLDKLGVKAEFFRVGAYKNAPDTFTRSSMSGEQREVEGSLLDDLYGRYLKRIESKRHLDEGKLKSLLDKGILAPKEAVDAGLLDGLLYPDQLEEEVGKLLGGKVALEKTPVEPPAWRQVRWGVRPKIVVVRVEGDILRGEGARVPLGAVEIAGSDPIARRIRRAADDPGVAAIVVRIDSPGGDGNASDLIWRELVRARKEKKKPVIASMGDVAASGGYYVAAGADEIWAEPSTITGSIGVFIGHFDAEELLGKLGLNLTTLKRGASADLFSPARALDGRERATLQAWVDSFYGEFVGRVAEARHLTTAEVDAVARGRVWTGAQALERRLVDHLGGLEDALASAKQRAGIDGEVEVQDETERSVAVTDLAGAGVLDAIPSGLAPRALRALHLLGEPGTVRAALPFDLEVR